MTSWLGACVSLGTVSAAMYASMHYRIPAIAASVVYASATSQPTVALKGCERLIVHRIGASLHSLGVVYVGHVLCVLCMLCTVL